MGNHAENVHQKLVSDPFIILVNNPKQSSHARNSFKNKIFWKRIVNKPLKKSTLSFFFSVLFNGQSYQKEKGSGTSDQPLFNLQNKFREILLLVMYYMTKFDGII